MNKTKDLLDTIEEVKTLHEKYKSLREEVEQINKLSKEAAEAWTRIKDDPRIIVQTWWPETKILNNWAELFLKKPKKP